MFTGQFIAYVRFVNEFFVCFLVESFFDREFVPDPGIITGDVLGLQEFDDIVTFELL